MDSLYNKNGLLFWTEEEIKLRDRICEHVCDELFKTLKEQNRAFEFQRVEAPILTPIENINNNYTKEDMYYASNDLVLRPETTMGSYVAAKQLLSSYNNRKIKLPLVVWQHGKSFRKEQDQSTKFMRLKEFYQLEFQILFAESTANDYYPAIINTIKKVLSVYCGNLNQQPSDRLPSYATETTDIITSFTSMELASISRRTDYAGIKNIEVAIGTDRMIFVYNELF